MLVVGKKLNYFCFGSHKAEFFPNVSVDNKKAPNLAISERIQPYGYSKIQTYGRIIQTYGLFNTIVIGQSQLSAPPV